jgi:hypothetical protein
VTDFARLHETTTRSLGLRHTGPESKWRGLAYVVFPGNVGGPDALARLVGALLD